MAEDKAGLSEPSTHTLDATASSNSISAQLTALDDAISTFRKGASNYADAALGTAAQSLAYGTSVLLGQAQEGKALACQAYKAGKQHVDAGLHEAAMAEEFVVSSLKSGIAAAALAPTYVTYPALAISTFMVLPWTRRILYNNTLGRFRSVDAIAQLCEGRVSGLKGTLEEVQAQSKELAEKARMAEDEMRRGRAALRDARISMQRLAGSVSKAERTASAVLNDLRLIKRVDTTAALRAEAASQLSALKAQRSALSRSILRIVKQDI